MKRQQYLLPIVIFISALSLFAVSCKKSGSGGGSTDKQLSDSDSLKYLMYRTMQKSYVDGGRDKNYDLPSYFWYKQVPETDPLNKTFSDAPALLNYMKGFPKDGQGRQIDTYSFLDDGTTDEQIQGGVAGDKGLEVTFAYDNNSNIILVVLYADKNSPAGLAGVRRGWVISKINGTDVVYDGPNGTNYNRTVNALFYDASASFTFKKPDGSTTTTTLASANYQINPVLFDTVYDIGTRKVGYFVFYTFSNVTSGGSPTLTKTELDRVFNKFSNNFVTDVIVDLRYNHGGSTNTAEYLTTQLAPSSVAGKEMYHFEFNDKLTAHKTEIGLPDIVNFQTGGTLSQLQNIFFIVNSQSASASELVINNLKPYTNVQMVGDTTRGKPAGFFTFTLSIYKNGIETFLADLYAINFVTKNSANQGDYYRGMIPDKLAADYVGYDWGEEGDDNLDKIFNYIATGSYGRTIPLSDKLKQDPSVKIPAPIKVPRLRFEGMVSERVSNVMQKETKGRIRPR
ncbi:MAG: hypothetical protein J5I50_12715 [Chitinophagaceae bacterium]|nr:hypothetical protein [Chitinophagaceae bacterium]